MVDVLRSDSTNLLDIDGLADFLDDWMEEGRNEPPNNDAALVGAGSFGMVTTINTQPKLEPPEFLRSSSSGQSGSENTKASGSGNVPAAPKSKAQTATEHTDEDVGRERKRRTRNQQQMEHNRVAQQKYRERKKIENSELQNAVDLLTAELAAMKALEFRARELETYNAGLSQQVAVQQEQIHQLQSKVLEQDATIASQAGQLNGQMELLAGQQKMILDQHQKMKLQEEIIASLKDRIKESVDQAWDSLESQPQPDPHTVCRRMHEAVRRALQGATDMDSVQETLAKLPDAMVVEICKNIMIACKEMFPQITEKLALCGSAGKFPVHCSAAAGPVA